MVDRVAGLHEATRQEGFQILRGRVESLIDEQGMPTNAEELTRFAIEVTGIMPADYVSKSRKVSLFDEHLFPEGGE